MALGALANSGWLRMLRRRWDWPLSLAANDVVPNGVALPLASPAGAQRASPACRRGGDLGQTPQAFQSALAIQLQAALLLHCVAQLPLPKGRAGRADQQGQIPWQTA